jgi:inosine-uridine nucleoside N-ribohydrolase
MKILTLFLMIGPSVLFAQMKGFGVSVFHNSMFNSELFTNNNFVFEKVKSKNPSILAGVHYTSLGKNKKFSLRHGVDILIPYQRPMLLVAPQKTYTFITNAVSYRFLNSKILAASFQTDIKFMLEKRKFEKELPENIARRWILGGGFSIQPLPERNKLKLVYQLNITPVYIWEKGNLDMAFHYSSFGVEYGF